MAWLKAEFIMSIIRDGKIKILSWQTDHHHIYTYVKRARERKRMKENGREGNIARWSMMELGAATIPCMAC